MKNLLMVSTNFQKGENPANFLFLALDEASSLDAIKNTAENKETIADENNKNLETRYNLVKGVITDAAIKLSENQGALDKFTAGVQASLLGQVDSDFPLISLVNQDHDLDKGVDYNEFQEYIKYLEQMLAGIKEMPELNEKYKTTEEKRKAYELISDYSNEESPLDGVVDLVKNGVEIETIEARIKIYKAISGDNINKLKTDLDGSWYQLDYAEEVMVQVGEIRGKLFDTNYIGRGNDDQIDTDFTGWDEAGDPNFSQWGKEHMSEQEFLQRLLTYSDVSGSEIGQAFSTEPSVSKQKTELEKTIRDSSLAEEQRQQLGILESDVLTGEALTSSIDKLENLKKAERLEKFLDSLEKWDGMEVEGFGDIREIRNQIRNNPKDLSPALSAVNRILEDFSDYYETNDNFWDWGILNYISPIHQIAGAIGAFDNFGQQGAEWIMASDTNLGIALRSVKDTQQAGEVMQNEMMHLKLISAKKESDRSPEEKTFLAEHSEEIPAIQDISEKAKIYEKTEGLEIAKKRYQDLLESLRDKSGGDLPPEYLQILAAGKENVIKGIASRLSFQHATEDYIDANGTDNLAGSTLLDQYNDMKGLDGFWNWSDENVEMGKEIAKMIVVIIITSIVTAGVGTLLELAAAAAEGAEVVGATAILATEGLEGAEAVNVAINGIKGIKNAETIAAALEGVEGANAAKNAAIAASEALEASRAFRIGAKVYNVAENGGFFTRNGAKVLRGGAKIINKANKIDRATTNFLEIGGNAKWYAKGLKFAGNLGYDAVKGAAMFTSVEAGLFGVDSPDEFLAKFGQNVEMFALFGGAGKISEALTPVMKSSPKLLRFLAQQGIAMTSEFGVFATFQAIETGLYRGDIGDFSWKELAHMMTFSMVMRLAHAGFPKLAGKLRDVKNKEIKVKEMEMELKDFSNNELTESLNIAESSLKDLKIREKSLTDKKVIKENKKAITEMEKGIESIKNEIKSREKKEEIKNINVNSNKSQKQTKEFYEKDIVEAGEKIVDGYKDGGGSSKFNTKGELISSNREIIVVNRSKDPVLREKIKEVKEKFQELPPKEKLKKLAEYVNELFGGKKRNIEDLSDKALEGYDNKDILLGEIIESGVGVCRHRSLAFKILAEEIGIKTSLKRGLYSDYAVRGRHAWNIVEIGGEKFLVDVMHGKLANAETFRSGEMGNYQRGGRDASNTMITETKNPITETKQSENVKKKVTEPISKAKSREISAKTNSETQKSKTKTETNKTNTGLRENLRNKKNKVKDYLKKKKNGLKDFFKNDKVKEKVETEEGKNEVVEHVAKDVQANTGLTWNKSLKVAGALVAVWGMNALASALDEDDKPNDVDIDAILDDIFAENTDNVVVAKTTGETDNSGSDNSPNETPPSEEQGVLDSELGEEERQEGIEGLIPIEPRKNNVIESGAAIDLGNNLSDIIRQNPAKFSVEQVESALAGMNDISTLDSKWEEMTAGGNVETKTTDAGQEYEIFTDKDGNQLMKITHSHQKRRKAKAGEEGWFLNRKGGVKKGDIRDILGRENVRRRDIKKVANIHQKDEAGVDTFTRIYRINKRDSKDKE